MLILVILCILINGSHAQHFIGKHKDEIKVMMKESKTEFRLDRSMINPVYNYLKYTDEYDEQTLLYFLDDNDYCITSKLMCDYALLNKIINNLNETYTSTNNKNEWMYTIDDEKYIINLYEEKWFFTVITKKY